MNFLKRLKKMFELAPPPGQYVYWIYVRCNRCGEVIRGRVNMMNELSQQFIDADGASGYITRKVLMGSERCYQPIEVTLEFDLSRKLKNREIRGGTFITEEEYFGNTTEPGDQT